MLPGVSQTGVSVVGPGGQKAMNKDSVIRHRDNAMKAGIGNYWQAAKPSRPLKLTGAINYVAKNYSNQPANNRFVYWPDLRVAGTVNDIVNVLRAADINQLQEVGALSQLTNGVAGQRATNVALNEDVVRNNSIDPLNPAHADIITAIAAQVQPAAKTAAKHSLEEYIAIGNVLKGAKTTTTTTASTGATRGTRSPETNRNRLVNEFNQMMAQVLGGQDVEKLPDVSKFDGTKFTGATKQATPKTGRSTKIRPTITVQGRLVPVPVVAKRENAANFDAYVRGVIGASQYAQYVDEIIRSFNATSQAASVIPAAAATGLTAPVTIGSTMSPSLSLPPAGAQAASPPAGGLALPTLGGGVNLPSIGTTSPGSPGGAASPPPSGGLSGVFGSGLPQVGQAGGGLSLPTLN